MLWHSIISVYLITLLCALFQVQTACPAGCVCDQIPNWKTEELTLNCLREVEVSNLIATDHEAALVKRLFGWATVLETMTVTFHRSVAGSKANEFCQMLQSFSRPEISLKGPHFAWSSRIVIRRTTCSRTICMLQKLLTCTGGHFVVLMSHLSINCNVCEHQNLVHPSALLEALSIASFCHHLICVAGCTRLLKHSWWFV